MSGRTCAAVVSAALLTFAVAGCGDDSLKADAGADFSVAVGTAPEFDGCDSSGNIVNYSWSIRETPSKMAEDVGKAIRAEDLSTLVIVVSGDIQPEARARVMKLGVLDFVKKPVAPETITDTLKRFGIPAVSSWRVQVGFASVPFVVE